MCLVCHPSDLMCLVCLVSQLGKQCVQQAESCVLTLTDPVTSGGDSSDSGVDTRTGGSRQTKLDLMLDRLQTTRSSLEEVTALLNENTSIMERFQLLQTQDAPEELKSWECIPFST
ncbi:hypothetical protein EGW08_014256 [Elysia chlorotica]|uniref:Uncharacterized protein n=1 Tax=Elysia chlorotica TaxID=188477 RepID=A0A3S0ZLW8_ELYCH|nr:hypothetical protein EGW08_014256 [Elysia chlorotica]